MQKNLLTIIIPVFNSEEYLGETLKCLAAQVCQNFEVLIVDDRSTDKTEAVAEDLLRNFRLTFFKKNRGMRRGAAASINYGFSRVRTKYWALLDSDAFLQPNWTEVIVSLLEESPNDDIVGAPIFASKVGGTVAYLIGLEIESRYQKLNEGPLRHLSTCNIAGKQEILKFIHLNEDLDYAYDHQLSFQLKPHSVEFVLTKRTYCEHVNKSGFYKYFMQQYKIAKYHTLLSKKMPKQAIKGDEISPSYLLLQPIALVVGVALLPVNYLASVGLFLFVFALNWKFILYSSKKSLTYLAPVLYLALLKNIAWVGGAVVGTVRKNI